MESSSRLSTPGSTSTLTRKDEASTWVEKFRIFVCGSHCQFECPSKASDTNVPWAKALAWIQCLDYFSIHTYTCGGNVAFGEDGIFAEDSVQKDEDGDVDEEKGISLQIVPEPMAGFL
jgi:hypothetical protein